MANSMDISRRSFLKTTSTGAAGLTVLGSGVYSAFSAQKSRSSWSNGMKINPEIENNRVVCCHNPAFFIDQSKATVANTFQKQNAAVDSSRVETDMDGLAISLSGKDDPQQAWATIFRKPSNKEWNLVKVAIKLNVIYEPIMPRVAIVGKVCEELINLGVSPANISIYDACSNTYGNGKYNSYVGNGIPQGVTVANLSLYSVPTKSIAVGSKQIKCASLVLDSDILVNIAVNKGHDQADKGAFTLCMKNHTGTFIKSTGFMQNCPTLQEMIDEHKSEAVVGNGDPVRQQLCIVDSLWAAVKGPGNPADCIPARIAMGTFGPAVDILVTREIREKIMGASHTESAISTILSSFDFSEVELEWVEVPPYVPVSSKAATAKKSDNKFSVVINRKGLKKIETQFNVASHDISKIEILDFKGRTVRSLVNSSRLSKIEWNGKSDVGKRVKSGKYLIRIQGNGFTRSQQVSIY